MIFSTIVTVLYNYVLAMSLWAPRGQRLHFTRSSVMQMLVRLANGFLWPLVWLLDLGSQVTDRYLDIAFSVYLPGKGCSECPELPGAGKSSNRTAPLGLRELPPGGGACSRRGLGSGPRRERVYQSLGVRMNAPASNSLPTAESGQEVRVWARK